MAIDRIVPEALKLSLADRVELASSIWESIGDPYFLEADQSDEDATDLALARDSEIESGEVTPLTHDDLMKRLRG